MSSRTLQAHYVERCERMMVVNAPAWIRYDDKNISLPVCSGILSKHA